MTWQISMPVLTVLVALIGTGGTVTAAVLPSMIEPYMEQSQGKIEQIPELDRMKDFLERAYLQFKEKNHEKSRGLYEEVIAIYPTAVLKNDDVAKYYYLNALNGIAENFLHEEEIKHSLDTYNQVLEIDNRQTNALIGKANVMVKEEEYNEAISLYNRALHEDSQLVNAYLGKGTVFAIEEKRNGTHNLSTAIDNFEKALKYCTNKNITYMKIADILVHIGYYELSVEYARNVIDIQEYSHEELEFIIADYLQNNN